MVWANAEPATSAAVTTNDRHATSHRRIVASLENPAGLYEERPGFAGALPSVGGYGGPFRGPPWSGLLVGVGDGEDTRLAPLRAHDLKRERQPFGVEAHRHRDRGTAGQVVSAQEGPMDPGSVVFLAVHPCLERGDRRRRARHRRQ